MRRAAYRGYVQVLDDGAPSGTARVVAAGRPLHVADAAASGELRQDLVERFRAASVLFLPLAWAGEVRHVAISVFHRRRELSGDELALGRALADTAAAGLARLEADARARARTRQDEALVRAARALNATLELGEVLRTLSREAAHAVDGDISGVYLGNADAGAVATAGHNVSDAWHGITLAAGEGAAGQALATGERSRPTTTTARPTCRRTRRCASPAPPWPSRWRGTTAQGRPVGGLDPAAAPIEAEDVRTLEAIADLATVACCNAETYEEVQQAARTDALTGLLNHGAMQVRLREEIARARRERRGRWRA